MGRTAENRSTLCDFGVISCDMSTHIKIACDFVPFGPGGEGAATAINSLTSATAHEKQETGL